MDIGNMLKNGRGEINLYDMTSRVRKEGSLELSIRHTSQAEELEVEIFEKSGESIKKKMDTKDVKLGKKDYRMSSVKLEGELNYELLSNVHIHGLEYKDLGEIYVK